jgi:hypothetical protein
MTTYLSDSEYDNYGMEPATAESLVAAASTLINTYCRRPTFAIFQYTERIRVAPERNNVRLTYLPLAIAQGASSPLVSVPGALRHAAARGGYHAVGHDASDCHGVPTAGNVDRRGCEHL